MNSTVPLPEPDCRGVHFDGYSSDQMRTHAAAQSAADNDVLTARVEVLESALSQAADSIERWGDFKWDLAGDIIAARAALEKP